VLLIQFKTQWYPEIYNLRNYSSAAQVPSLYPGLLGYIWPIQAMEYGLGLAAIMQSNARHTNFMVYSKMETPFGIFF